MVGQRLYLLGLGKLAESCSSEVFVFDFSGYLWCAGVERHDKMLEVIER